MYIYITGACIECSETGCKKKYHVTCGLEREVIYYIISPPYFINQIFFFKVLMKYITSKTARDTIASYCQEHSGFIYLILIHNIYFTYTFLDLIRKKPSWKKKFYGNEN